MQCPVCLIDLSPNEKNTIQLSCYHYLCQPCLSKLDQFQHHQCPLCRAPIYNLPLVVRRAYQKNYFFQTKLGIYYQTGNLVAQNYQLAFYWFQKAARKGVGAQYYLGNYYLHGLAGKINYSQAMYWFYKAAQNNDSESLNNLGYMYYLGLGVKKNLLQAMTYFLRSYRADNQNNFACYNIGKMYLEGYGSDSVKYQKAYLWLQRSADLNSPDAHILIGNMYYSGKYLPFNLSLAEEEYWKANELSEQKLGWRELGRVKLQDNENDFIAIQHWITGYYQHQDINCQDELGLYFLKNDKPNIAFAFFFPI